MARKRDLFHGQIQLFLKRGLSWFLLMLFGLISFLALHSTLPVAAKQYSFEQSTTLPTTRTLTGLTDDLGQGLTLLAQTPETESLLERGRNSYQRSEFEEAISVWQEAKASYGRQDVFGRALVSSYLSLAYQQLGQLEQAEAVLGESLDLLESKRDENLSVSQLKVFAQVLNTQARLQLIQGKADEALRIWEEAAEVYELADDSVGVTGSLLNQANALQVLGRYRDSLKILMEVQSSVDTELGANFKILQLQGLAKAFRAIGDLDRAKEALLAISSVSDLSPQEETQQLVSLGNIYWDLGDRERLPQIPSPSLTAAGCVVQPKEGDFLESNDDANEFYEKALGSYEEALIKRKNATEISGSAIDDLQISLQKLRLHIQLQDIYGDQQNKDEQRQKAVEINQAISKDIDLLPINSIKLNFQINLAQSQICLNRDNLQDSFSNITQLLAQAYNNAVTLENQKAEAYILGKQGLLNELMYNSLTTNDATAITSYSELDNLLLDAENLTRESLRVAQAQNNPEIIYPLQWQLGRLLKQKSKESRQEAISAYTEAIDTAQSIRRSLTGVAAGLLVSSAEDLGSKFELTYFNLSNEFVNNSTSKFRPINTDIRFYFRDNAEPIYRELIDLLLQDTRIQNSDEIELGTEEAEIVYTAIGLRELLEIAELENFLDCDLRAEGDIDSNAISSVSNVKRAVQQKLQQIYNQDSKVAISFPIIFNEKLTIIVSKKDKLIYRETSFPDSDSIENIIRKLRINASRSVGFKTPESAKLYKLILQPIEPYLVDIDTLGFVLDDYLRNIPMALLYDESENKFLLHKHYATVVIPGLQLLKLNQQDKTKTALVGGISRVSSGTIKIPDDTEDHIEKVAQQMSSLEKLINEDFTSSNLQRVLSSKSFPIIHFVTHGQFSSSSRQEATYLSAYNGEKIGIDDLRNVLGVSNENSSDPIQLLVFGACKTATGDRRAALGLAGVAVRSGSVSTLATLWNISGSPNPGTLFGEFYRQFFSPTVSTAKALQIAQRKMYQQNDNPYFWSPYILVGNWY